MVPSKKSQSRLRQLLQEPCKKGGDSKYSLKSCEHVGEMELKLHINSINPAVFFVDHTL